MVHHAFTLAGETLHALPSGALYWPAQALLAVSDLHFGKSERRVRRGGMALPPYEVQETLTRLQSDLDATRASTVICLGDSFDDLAASDGLPDDARLWIARLQAGRRWIWAEGNHDPGPVDLGGTHLAELRMAPLTFRHIADPTATAEISGHYHPKAQIRTRAGTLSRPAFLIDADRVILPAYGTYTGGLRSTDAALSRLMAPSALAVLTGARALAMPMPR
ncbi:MAG: ligase-associated DNA damage response endonuclease PdeM [Paracoccaceae bacterium]|nr:ligase-associated DNA damage response endonuclease PdeM [Paracoccaceae bacterium]